MEKSLVNAFIFFSLVFILILFLSNLVNATCTVENCSGSVPGQVCMEYYCESTEVCATRVVLGCCGNKLCEAGESYSSCPTDCAPKIITLELKDFEDKEYLRGDNVQLKVKVLADGTFAKGANVTATGFFGTINLFDDGLHNDNKESDGIYGGTVTIGRTVQKNDYTITLTAEKTGTSSSKTFILKVNPTLDLNFEVTQTEYYLGDIIDLNGYLKKKDMPLRKPVSINFLMKEKNVFDKTFHVVPDENGNFFFSQKTSLIDPAGEWSVSLTAQDDNYNIGFKEIKVKMMPAKESEYLHVELIEPSQKAFNRGQEINFLVKVADPNGNLIRNADVALIFPAENKIFLDEISPGNYGMSFYVPFDFELGEQSLTIIASKKINNVVYTGFVSKNIFINKIPISIEIIEPKKSHFNLGEKIDFEFQLYYSFNRPVINAKVDLNVMGSIIRANELGDGKYYASYIIPDENFGDLKVVLNVEDEFENQASKTFYFKISPEIVLLNLILRDPLIYGLLIVAILFFAVIIFLLSKNFFKLILLQKRKNELTELKKKLQQEYFNDQLIGSEEYYTMLDKYNEELEAVNAKIKMLKIRE